MRLGAKNTATPHDHRAVFDCMVFLQAAARKDGPAAACLELARQDQIALFTHPQIIDEIKDVLTRPKVQARFPALTAESVRVFLTEVENHSQQIPDVPIVFQFERDRKDEIYLNLAIAVGARYLVSWDKDLLDLMDQDREESTAFRSRFPNLLVVTPVAFLQESAGKRKTQ